MKHFISFTLLLSVIILSCKKDANPGSAEITYKVKTITDQSSGTVTNYEYDAQNRIQKVIRPGVSTGEFLYSPELVTGNTYNSSGTLILTRQYELNADELVGTERDVFPLPAGPYNYTYNSSKQVTSITYLDGANGNALLSKVTYYYSDKKMDSMRVTNPDGKVINRMAFEYYPGINNTISEQHRGFLLRGRQSTLAIKKQTLLVYAASGTLTNTVITNFTYETDAQGRINRSIETVNGFPPRELSYTYY